MSKQKIQRKKIKTPSQPWALHNAKGVLKKSKCDELGNLDPSRCFHKPIPKNTLCFSLRICQQE